MDKSFNSGSGGEQEDENYRNVEYLDTDTPSDPLSERYPSFEDPLTKTPEAQFQDDDGSSYSEQSLPQNSAAAELNVAVNLSAKEFKKYAFHVVGVFYSRLFKTQRLAEPVHSKDVFGNTIDELFHCIWKESCSLVSREVVVDLTQEEKTVHWSTKEKPDYLDINKFVVLRNQKTKKLYSIEDLREGSKILASWRGKRIQIHVYKYSTSLVSNTIWELVNKNLLRPGKKDRAGAPTTEELFACISELKEVHCHYTALHSIIVGELCESSSNN